MKLNTPTDKEIRDWYMGYGVEGRPVLSEFEGEAFDRYFKERDARVTAETIKQIIKLLEDSQLKDCKDIGCTLDAKVQKIGQEDGHDYDCGNYATQKTISLILKGKNK